MRMHEGQVDVAPTALAAALAQQFPAWAGRPLVPLPSAGTMVVRRTRPSASRVMRKLRAGRTRPRCRLHTPRESASGSMGIWFSGK